MDTKTIRKAIGANPAAAATVFNKHEIYAVIGDIATSIRQPGESMEKARVRATTTPKGATVMTAYAAAPKAQPLQQSRNVSIEEIRKSMNAGDVVAEVDAEARKLMAAQSDLSLAVARKMAWEADGGALKIRYDKRRAPTHGHLNGGRI
jgi:hypothetical protein